MITPIASFSRRLIVVVGYYYILGQRQLKAIRDSIAKSLPKGLEKETAISPQCVEFKLYDHPLQFHVTGANICGVMKLYTNIINRYYRYGWKVRPNFSV